MAGQALRGWTRCFHPAPAAEMRLVAFPHAGGSASAYRSLSAALSPTVEVHTAQYPGRQDRMGEPVIDDLHTLSEQMVDVVAALPKPFALFGHSMGAIVAFEVARLLEARGLVPAALFVSARRGPELNKEKELHLADDDTFLAAINRLGGTAAMILDDPDIRALALPALRGDYKAVETYRYRPGPDVSCPVVALAGDADPVLDLPDLENWREHTTGSFETEVFEGGHFFVDDHLDAVAARILGKLTVSP
ncbi:thioesterase II family protein [Amycolatopsis umgeniensis]|uniref:Surfactin synthase thioesterase subunit n=1 Tax=Amycolatopsis umgeniensis TaxID=336628 RepID=A0A841BEG3_9PSEU|nr:alpha/beta fold hydrolase [Amycolatopsis umgeniensis]MBB5857291.1 surfactin synthase thioesterase subunit [Amycolatopsis umgeniensis]